MPHEFHVDGEKRRLFIRISDQISAQEAEEILGRTMELRRRHGFEGILVDYTAVRALPDDLTAYRIGKGLAEFVRGRLRVAVVQGCMPEVEHFVQDVVRANGADRRVFGTMSDAEAWLDGGAGGRPDA